MDPVLAVPSLAPPAAGPSGGWRDLAGALAASTVVTLPVFLVGSLAVEIRQNLHFNAATLGVIVACYYATAATASVPLGHLAERVGGVRVMRVAPLVSGAALLVIAAVVGSWPALIVTLVVAGLASSAVQPAANLFLSRRIDARHQGLAFGIKQSAIPLASLLGGLAVPLIALTVGWRWAFAGAALLAVAACAVVPRPRQSLARRRAAARGRVGPEPIAPLAMLAAGFGLALMACTSLGTFLVTSGVAAGIGRGAAGLVAALASVLCLAARVAVGARADRRGGRHLVDVAVLLGLGAVGLLLLAVGSGDRLAWAFVPGAALAYAAGWGWNGLFNFAVVRSHPIAPARATGITQAGGRLGGMVGPLCFGLVAVHARFPAAWSLAAAEAVAGAGLILVGRRLLLAAGRDRPEPRPAPVQ